ncbi:glycosyl hydrolase family 18 protein [Paenibacillus sp. GCM10027627]|uniref:glycosyl hydrolase family 18 protein n=1 Tax=unclassified Paenibacillus TaxID=185978 RepID=UPI003633FF2E
MKTMNKKWSLLVAILLLVQAFAATGASVSAASQAGMTKYRVYQNDKALKEFVKEADAIRYAQGFGYSHVEQIADRKWLWDNFPRYKVYQNGKSTAKWEFRDYNGALAIAKTMKNVHIRDLETVGWAYESFSKYQLYQGDKTMPGWSFRTLDEAKKEAKKWGNAHIIELSSNSWVWDNLTASQIKAQSSAKAVYQLVVNGEAVAGKQPSSFLKTAVQASQKLAGSEVLNTATGTIVYSNVPSYEVRQNGKLIKSYIGLNSAVNYAKTLANAEVLKDGAALWSSYPYLEVYQGDKKIKTYHKLSTALSYAKGFANSSVRMLDGRAVWSNVKTLQFLGWNGSSNSSTILSHVANTQGLSIDSPTWFELTAADGTLKDMSDPAIVKTLKEKGVAVTPLVHNGFNRAMTTAFLKDEAAQTKFINALVNRSAELGVYGINLDFEEVAGADRAAYTAFVKKLTTAAHAKKLKLSIDLPRGSVSWNHLTAYDHAAIGAIVDTVIIMAYDEHWKGSEEPGSVAGLKWAEDGVKQFLDYGIPRSKLMLGIPFYVREWRIGVDGKLVDNRAILMKEVPRIIAENKAKGVFDPESGQWKYSYSKDGYTHVFWAETHDTVLARINIAKKYDLAGVAAWRLGYEDSELWTKMLQAR